VARRPPVALLFEADRIQATVPHIAELVGCNDAEALALGWRVRRDGALALAEDAELPAAALLAALQALPELVWVTDASGETRLLGGRGMSPWPEVKDWAAGLHPQDLPAVQEALAEARDIGMDIEYRRSNRWMWARAQPLKDAEGAVRWLAGLTIDITDTNTAIENLLASDRRARTLLEHDPDAVVVLENDVLVDVNGQSAGLTGYPGEALLGMKLEELLPSGEILLRPAWDAAVAANEPFEVRLLRRDGTDVPIEVRAVRAGKQLICYARDISGEKRREANRREERVHAQRRNTLESVGRLAGGVAHDFNNMLSVILNRAELLPPTENAEAILDAAMRASVLTRQLLVFSRENEVAVEAVAVDELVEGLCKLLERVLGEQVRLHVELGCDQAVSITRSELENALVNLATNARDAMPEGGNLSIRTSTEEREDGLWAQILVQDDGEGMTAEVAIHAFEPFFTTKALAVGTGLGLATTYGTVTRAGGTISLESAIGEGTNFRIQLPAVDVEGDTDDPVTAPIPTPDSAHILVVEDEEMVREVVTTMLRRLGHTVTSASSAEEALGLDNGYALLLTDVIMPGMSGRKLAESLRSDNPDLKVVFMSGYSADHLDGVDFPSWFLQKPFTLPRLATVVGQALEST
jgi:two-component system, cell cycle sensor histidine kinase and response regulator CckA